MPGRRKLESVRRHGIDVEQQLQRSGGGRRFLLVHPAPAQRGWDSLCSGLTALTCEELLCSKNGAVVTQVTMLFDYLDG